MTATFEKLAVPFRWSPALASGQYIVWIDLKISVYPSSLPILGGDYFLQKIYCYFLEGTPPRTLTQQHRLNFYHQRLYPPPGSRPNGVYCWSGCQAIKLSGEALLSTPLTLG